MEKGCRVRVADSAFPQITIGFTPGRILIDWGGGGGGVPRLIGTQGRGSKPIFNLESIPRQGRPRKC